MFGPFTFLIFMLIFTLVPIAIVWAKYHDFLWRQRRIVGLMVLCGLFFQLVSDPFAEGWGAWYFPRETTLGIWIYNFPIENTIYIVLIAIAISSAVLSLIHRQEGVKK